MTMTIGVVAFVVALLGSVMLHEAGHFLTARRFGMKATQFFVGFGPTLWSRRRGETEYGVKVIPAGGFVKIVGMTELEEVDPADQPRAFYRQPAPQRAVVLAAGSLVHFVIGFLLLLFVLMALGQPVNSTRVGSVAACVPAGGEAECGAGAQPSPAQAVGLQPGDRVVSFEGQPIETWEELTPAIRAAGAGPAELVVERDGRRITLNPTLVVRERPSLTDENRTERVGVLGVTPQIAMDRANPVEAFTTTADVFGTLFTASIKALGMVPAAIPDLVRQTFGDEPRSVEGLVGPVGIGRVSGEVLGTELPLAARIGDFLLLIAGLNVFIGIFNLLPLLPLDGGHLAVLGFETVRSRVYRLSGRPDPGRVDLNKLLPAAYLFLAVLIALSVLLLAADIVNPVTLPF